MWFTAEAIASWKAEPRTTRGGQPTYSDLAILTALTLRAVFRLALRQTEGLIGSVMGLLGLDLAVPDHSTLSRRAATVEVPRPRASPGAGPLYLLVDSTGLKLCGSGEWLHERHGTRVRRSWRKLHLGVDAGTGRIVASSLTTRDVDDGSQVGPLLDRVEEPLASFTGDGAYDGEGVTASIGSRHPEAAIIVPPRSTAVPSEAAETAPTQRDRHLRAIAEHGRMAWQAASGYTKRALAETAIVPPRSTAVPSEAAKTAPTQRDRHLRAIAEHGRMAWQAASGYTKRALAETAMSRFKRVIGDALCSHADERRATEVEVAVHVLNRMLELGRPNSVRVA